MTNAIQTLCDSGDMQKAINLYSSSSFLETIKKARTGNQFALLYTFYTARTTIASYMWKVIFGNKRFWKKELSMGKDYDYISEIMCILPKALSSFKDIYYDTNESLIQGWNNWMYNYVKVVKRYLLNKEETASLNVSIYNEDSKSIQLEDMLEDTKSSFEDNLHTSLRNESFSKKLSNSEKKLFAYISSGYSVQEMSEIYKVSRQRIYARINLLTEKYEKYKLSKVF